MRPKRVFARWPHGEQSKVVVQVVSLVPQEATCIGLLVSCVHRFSSAVPLVLEAWAVMWRIRGAGANGATSFCTKRHQRAPPRDHRCMWARAG